MPPARFHLALTLFHLGLIPVTLALGRAAWPVARDEKPSRAWLAAIARGAALFGAAALALAMAATLLAFLPAVHAKPGFLLARLMAQALFGEGLLLAAWAAIAHGRAGRRAQASLLAAAAAALFGIYWRAYHVEPFELHVRRHEVRLGSGSGRMLRILHMTDLQTPAIGAHEERAFRDGLAQRPDLVVFTGDYIHERVGRRTGASAARALRELLTRLSFGAPLGVFATEGDAGIGCRELFAGLPVRCLVDEGVRLELGGGASATIVGLAARTSRERDTERLVRVIEAAPPADHRIVIGHAPDFVSTLAGHATVDLALAGHTHGGQVALPFFGPLVTLSRLPRRYAGDLNDYQGIPLHVSRGVGMERGMAPQIRFLCPPEICVLDVKYGRTRPPWTRITAGRARGGPGGE
jgi:hypothetical protein